MIKNALGTYDIARICHVTPPTVGRWIEEGKLPSFTTGGGHRRVWTSDLLAFLKIHNIPIPFEFSAQSRLRILIVDDEADVRKVSSRILQKIYPQAEIHEAEDGFEAGHKIATLLPSLVLLDLRLPGMNGYRVCRMIRQDEHLKKIKVLAMSGYAMEESQKQSMEAGADDFMPKPFEVEELRKKVGKLISFGPKGG
ncbi:MAG: response regulator [Elusimicrobia bacterium]|nr:response regulator [Elusimicrobiota bacterium]